MFLTDALGPSSLRLIIKPLDIRRHAKEIIHLLQADTLGLGDEEIDEDAHEEIECRKHEEHALRH